MVDSCVWFGKDGALYEFEVHDLKDTLEDVSGLYIFVRDSGLELVPLYIGQTSSFRDSLNGRHEQWACALEEGMTHIHVLTNIMPESYRIQEELNLYRRYHPICNRRKFVGKSIEQACKVLPGWRWWYNDHDGSLNFKGRASCRSGKIKVAFYEGSGNSLVFLGKDEAYINFYDFMAVAANVSKPRLLSIKYSIETE